MEEANRKAETYFAESGDTYKWVGVLRAADIYWNPEKKPALILLEWSLWRGNSPESLCGSDTGKFGPTCSF